jgi:hypothetical protein
VPASITIIPSEEIAGPNSTIESESVPLHLADNELSLINIGTVKLFAYGEITYKDIFGEDAVLEFDTTYIPKSVCDFRVDKIVSHHERKKQENTGLPYQNPPQ